MSFNQRIVKIKNYRNIATNEGEECNLVINNYFGKEEEDWGDIVILIGHNNTGKSNVLSCLALWNESEPFAVSDATDYLYGPDKKLPDVEFIYQSSSATISSDKVIYRKSMVSKTKYTTEFIRPSNFTRGELTEEEEQFIKELAKELNSIYPPTRTLPDLYKREDVDNCLKGNFDTIKYEFVQDLFDYLDDINRIPTAFNKYMKLDMDNILASIKSKISFTQDEYDEKLKNVWHIKLHPTVLKYEEKQILNKELKLSVNEIESIETKAPILSNLFKYIQFDVNEIKNCIEGVDESVKAPHLKKITNKISKKLVNVNSDFNTLFPIEGEKKYEINISIDSNNIQLNLLRDDVPLNIEKQSSGFKWFFDFYFNFYIGSGLKAGDIVLLDEPCASLHEEGVKEFYLVLKDIIKKTHLTFFIVTHRASFINVDYLEEVRQISYNGGSIKIENKFNAIPNQENDALKPVLGSLLSKRNTLFDNRSSVPVFVEGITDYCYFTGYKQIYDNKHNIDLIFLPVEGLKSNSALLEKIHNLELVSLLLVDSDDAGQEVKKNSEQYKNIKVITLNDIIQDVTYVEDLFTKKDREKYSLGDKEHKPEKDFNNALEVKRKFLKNKEIENQTKDNFKKVFDYIYEYLDTHEIGFVSKENK